MSLADFAGGPVRVRLVDVVTRFELGEEIRHRGVMVSAGHVGQTLGNLDYCLQDYEIAQTEYQDASGAFAALQESWADGSHRLTEDEYSAFRRHSDAHFRLQFRVDTFYVFARILLDNIAAFLDSILAPSAVKMGKHAGVGKYLGSIGEAKAIDVAAVLALAASTSERVKPFRDDYVVHRSAKTPRVVRGVQANEAGRGLISAGGLFYPREGEEPPNVVAEDPAVVIGELENYLSAVLDIAETLTPSAR